MATVLILAREEVVAALLGLLVELSGCQPEYAQKGESAGEACARLSCKTLVIDCDHWECSRKSLAQFEELGVKIILFSPSRGPAELKRSGGKSGATAFTLPIGPEAFKKLLV